MSKVWAIDSPAPLTPSHIEWLTESQYKHIAYYFIFESASIYIQTNTEEQEMLLILKFGETLRITEYRDVDIMPIQLREINNTDNT